VKAFAEQVSGGRRRGPDEIENQHGPRLGFD
jgi:hypothetical protein